MDDDSGVQLRAETKCSWQVQSNIDDSAMIFDCVLVTRLFVLTSFLIHPCKVTRDLYMSLSALHYATDEASIFPPPPLVISWTGALVSSLQRTVQKKT